MATSTSTSTSAMGSVVDHLGIETDVVQANNSGSLATTEEKGESRDGKIPETTPSESDDDNRRPTSAAAVSPTASVFRSEFEPISTSVNDNEVRPIRLEDFDEATEGPSIRRISVQLIKGFSFDSEDSDRDDESGNRHGGVPEKKNSDDCNDGEDENDDKEQDWTEKIAATTDSSGNLIEDLHADSDESSTSSMTTIIGSEHSSRAEVEDDIEGIFSLGDDNDRGENVDNGDHRGTVDPLHSKCFVVFGDDYDGRKLVDNRSQRDIMDSKDIIAMKEERPPTRPRTSRINPMTGRRSLTDDMQEWRNKVLSSWTLTKPKKRKYNSRKKKRKIEGEGRHGNTAGQHGYKLRRTTDSATTTPTAASSIDPVLESETMVPLRKKCRELQNISSFNLPGMKNSYGDGSILSIIASTDGNEVNTKQEDVLPNAVPRDTSVPSCHPQMDCNDFVSKSSGPRGEITQAPQIDNEREKIVPLISESKQLRLKVRIEDTIFVPEDEKDDELHIPASTIGSLGTPNGLIASGAQTERKSSSLRSPAMDVRKDKDAIGNINTTTSNGGKSGLNDNEFSPSSRIDEDLSSQMRKKKADEGPCVTASSTTCPIVTRDVKKNQSSTTMTTAGDDSRSGKQSVKPSRTKSEESPNAKTMFNGSTRVAKRFFFNPTRRKGQDKLKIYFGTVVSKRMDEETDGTSGEIWHVLYDDGDEEDFDTAELNEALTLYKSAKRWDKKHRKKHQIFARENKEKPKNVRVTEKGRGSSPIEESDTPSSKENQSLLLQNTSVAASKPRRAFDEKKKIKLLSSSERIKQSDFNQGQQEMSGGLQCVSIDLSCHDGEVTEGASDDDSIRIVDVVDLTKDNGKTGKVVDIVDLTINSKKKKSIEV
jgi:hypothetical protein